jgi:lipopolysaccharide/colanic/teichoic acid biosynthesis glycosyltransferase
MSESTEFEQRKSLFYIKRLMDVVGGLVGLCATALLYVPIALAIKWDSPGPVIYAQDRVGKDKCTFRLYKFRTMRVNLSGHGFKPGPNDERVTRMGRFLRRTSLDELPQFFNILRGDMSLVGPRPEQWVFEAHYQDWQRRRFKVKPGLTGWWQVNGRKQPMHEHIDEDIYYVDHCSLRLDLLILFRTVWAVISGEGAV